MGFDTMESNSLDTQKVVNNVNDALQQIHTEYEIKEPHNNNGEEEKINENSKPIKQFSIKTRQCFAVLGPLITVVSAGMVSGYSAILIPQLLDINSTVPFSPADASWIASVGVLPMGPGCFIGGYLMEKYGRRTSHMIVCVPMILGWVTIACAELFYKPPDVILLGRFITGAASGILGPPVSVFIGEISVPKYRGLFLGGISLSIASGILIAHILGTFLTWQMTAVISSFLPLICYILIKFVPESPTWLLARGELDKAEKAFKWFRGSSIESIDEFQNMVNRHLTEKHAAADQPKPSLIENIKTNFTKKEFLHPLGIILVFFSTLQFSGVNAVVFYTVTILENTLKKGINEYFAMILIDCIRVFMSIVACICMKNYGRRPISLIGTTGTAISFLGLSLFLYLMQNSLLFSNAFWLPLLCFISFVIFTTLGLVPMPWCLVGELFPLHQRGLGTGISTAWNFVAFFIVVKTSPRLFREFGSVQTFFMYGCVALAGAVFLWFKLPETKNQTLQDIEDNFSKSKKTKANKENRENNNVIV